MIYWLYEGVNIGRHIDFVKGLTLDESYGNCLATFSKQASSRPTEFRWYNEYKRGREGLENETRTRRPVTAVTKENAEAVKRKKSKKKHEALWIGFLLSLAWNPLQLIWSSTNTLVFASHICKMGSKGSDRWVERCVCCNGAISC